MKDTRTMPEKAFDAYDGSPPAWVVVLADAIQANGTTYVANLLGYTNPALSQIIHNKYGTNRTNIEDRVRAKLMGATVQCPVQGIIGREACLDWQGRPFRATSSLSARMYRACRANCPHSRIKGGGNAS
ncbi:putative transcriptional regulator [Roseibium sp. TrichSKD4]|uniref:hypothetical protein n=1 Tax=Roseibium sp. TrichSKD4 TaxID=744980 RepID=UPI0001E5761C|nr:hypothetical protein [Roseibium sp. TrichSKD4]EFO30963.1 putative transcriptional regulator [Roseibium sp. TrichSKD4]